MNEFDRKIRKILKKEVSKPLKYEYAINSAFKSKEEKNNVAVFCKIVAITFCGVFSITGIVGATTYTISKIWKEPTFISQEEEEKQEEKQEEEIKKPITDEEKEEMITEQNAVQIAENILDTLGYEGLDISEVNIVRGYNEKKRFILRTESDLNNSIMIELNALNGEFEYFCNDAVLSKNLKCDNISEESAKEIANNIYKKLGVIKENDKYEILSAKRQDIVSNQNINDMWQVTFAKKYNDSFDNDTAFTTTFSVVNGETIFHIVKGKREGESNFDNNSIILSKEEAIKIAVEKEKEFSQLDILETNAELSIEKMNIFIYCLENNISNTNSREYKVDNISRNVWVVRIKHKKDFKPRNSDLETIKTQYDKKYFVDATTGEIIGGEQIEYFND